MMSSTDSRKSASPEELSQNEKHDATTKSPDPSGSEDISIHEDIDGDYGSYSNHVFSDPKVAEYWRNVYENAHYEGRHRFDPSFTWGATEEKRLKRKVGSSRLSSLEGNTDPPTG